MPNEALGDFKNPLRKSVALAPLSQDSDKYLDVVSNARHHDVFQRSQVGEQNDGRLIVQKLVIPFSGHELWNDHGDHIMLDGLLNALDIDNNGTQN